MTTAAPAAPGLTGSSSPVSSVQPPMIEVRDLVKRYKGADRNAVDGISFEVRRGDLFAFLGPNGAGKTTTVSILTTTLAPTSGSIRIAGHDLDRGASAIRREIGIIFQQPSLDLNLTGEHNLRFHSSLFGIYPFRPAFRLMPRAYRQQVWELAGLVGLRDDLFRPVRTYSGGMRRRLEVIRSLLHRPDVLFLDEPTVGLDPSSRRALRDHLRQIRAESGTTIFLTTHYLEEAEEADAIAIIDRGQIVARGTPAEVTAELGQAYLVVEANDRVALLAELDRLELEHDEAASIRIALDGRSVHEVLRSIETPLTRVRTHNPSLEEAYLDIVAAAELEVGSEEGEAEAVAVPAVAATAGEAPALGAPIRVGASALDPASASASVVPAVAATPAVAGTPAVTATPAVAATPGDPIRVGASALDPAAAEASAVAATPLQPHRGGDLAAIATIAWRDLLKFGRDRSRLVATFIFPFLFIGLLGGSLQANLGGSAGYDFLTFTFTGVLAMTLFQSTAQGIISLIEDRESDFSQEIFVSPVSRRAIIFGKVLGETLVAIPQAAGILAFGVLLGVPMSIPGLFALLPAALVICLLGGAFGVLVLANLPNQRAANQVFPFFMLPQYFLAGIFVPIAILPWYLDVLSHLSPMRYAVDLMRGVWYQGSPEAALVVLDPLLFNLVVIGLMFVVFFIPGTYLFVRNERNR